LYWTKTRLWIWFLFMTTICTNVSGQFYCHFVCLGHHVCMYSTYYMTTWIRQFWSIICLSQYQKWHCVINLFCMKIIVPKNMAIGIEETDMTLIFLKYASIRGIGNTAYLIMSNCPFCRKYLKQHLVLHLQNNNQCSMNYQKQRTGPIEYDVPKVVKFTSCVSASRSECKTENSWYKCVRIIHVKKWMHVVTAEDYLEELQL